MALTIPTFACRPIAAVAVFAALGALAAPGRSQDAPDPAVDEEAAPAPAEAEAEEAPIDLRALIRERMKVFRAYEGEWEGAQSYAEAEGQAAFDAAGSWNGHFSMDGVYFEMHGTSDYPSGKSEYAWRITFDVLSEKYRAWTFNSNGMVTEWVADYDAGQKEFTWRFTDERTGITGWLRTKAAPNALTGKGQAKAENGRLISDYSIAYRRKKLRV